jgi:hypothetical protein
MTGDLAKKMANSTPFEWIFYMPQICDMGQTALLPLRRKACLGFFRPEKSDGFGRVRTRELGSNCSSPIALYKMYFCWQQQTLAVRNIFADRLRKFWIFSNGPFAIQCRSTSLSKSLQDRWSGKACICRCRPDSEPRQCILCLSSGFPLLTTASFQNCT